MNEIKLNNENYQIVKIIAEYGKVSPEYLVNDVIKTFLDMPVIMTCDLETYCVKQLDFLDIEDKHSSSTFTSERRDSINRIKWLVDLIYNAKVKKMKKCINENVEDNQ